MLLIYFSSPVCVDDVTLRMYSLTNCIIVAFVAIQAFTDLGYLKNSCKLVAESLINFFSLVNYISKVVAN